jgi:transcription-repair coupling factor (superfamily II helicase)
MEYKTPKKDRERAKKWREENPEYGKKYYHDNKDELKKRRKKRPEGYYKNYYQANKERLSKYQMEWKRNNKEKVREIKKKEHLKRTYNLTPEDMVILLDEHENKCKICSIEFNDDIKYHVDHCHSTEKIRGLLCRNCNLGLGFFKDDTKVLIKAIEYLKEQGEEAPPEGN